MKRSTETGGSGCTEKSEVNAFRAAERKYKRRYTQNSSKRRHRKKITAVNTDYKDVIDFRNVDANTDENKSLIVEMLPTGKDQRGKVYRLKNKPGTKSPSGCA